MYGGGGGGGVCNTPIFQHPTSAKPRWGVEKWVCYRTTPPYMCVKRGFFNCFFSGGAAGAKKAPLHKFINCVIELFFILNKCDVCIESMPAANFSRDVLEMFYGKVLQEENQRLISPIRPRRRLDFEIERTNFNQWLRVWKMRVPGGNRDILKFFQKTKSRFEDVCREEVKELRSVKIQFGVLVSFNINRNGEVERMEHYFNRMQPIVMNQHNINTLNHMLNRFVDEVRGEIEAWSQRGSGWVVDEILEAFINVAQYQPLNGGSYMLLPEKLKSKKAVLNMQNRDNMCLRWAIRAALFPAQRGLNPQRTSSYPTNDGLNFEGINFPTPVSQIDKLERQNPNLALNVFGWENEQVIVHRISEKEGHIPRIHLMITKQGDNTHYSWVKRLTALLYDQNRHNESKHFCSLKGTSPSAKACLKAQQEQKC